MATRKWKKFWRYVCSFWQNVRMWQTDTAWRLSIASRSKNGNKTIKINVINFHGSLTVVRAQNDTSKTANITDTIFDRTYWYSPYKRRHFKNRWDQIRTDLIQQRIFLIKDVLSVNLHSVTRPTAYYYYYLAIQRSVWRDIKFAVFVLFFVCLYGWGYLNAGWCDRREILAQVEQTSWTGTR